jgi:hypothetical protein
MANRSPIAAGAWSLSQGFGCTGYISEPALFGCAHYHAAIDMAAAIGTPVMAVADGLVTAASWNGCIPAGYKLAGCWAYGGGYVVFIQHNSRCWSAYCHLNDVTVRPGQYALAGQVIGHVGQTGYATGPHLHHAVEFNGLWITSPNWAPVDPRRYWSGGDQANSPYIIPQRFIVSADPVNVRTTPHLSGTIAYVVHRGWAPHFWRYVHGDYAGYASDLWAEVRYNGRWLFIKKELGALSA